MGNKKESSIFVSAPIKGFFGTLKLSDEVWWAVLYIFYINRQEDVLGAEQM